MRFARPLTVVAATAAATAALVATTAPVSAQAAPYQPRFELQSLRYLVDSDVTLAEFVSPGTFAIDTSRISDSFSWDISRIVQIKYSLDNAGTISGYCTYSRSGVGIESGGVTFTLAGEATAVGRYRGSEIVATGIACTLYKPDMTMHVGPVFSPGSVVATATSEDSYDARGGLVCAEAWALLRSTPPGMSSPLVSTGYVCH